MGFYFIIQSGTLKGTRHKVRSNMILGRGFSADLSIKDPKMSSTHAQVQKKEGKFYLIDKGSKNKINSNNQKKEVLLLEDGLFFKLGNTKFQIKKTETKSPLVEESWDQLLYHQLSQKTFANALPSKNIKAFTPMVKLTFITGLQRKTKWTLGYGPRHIGANSYDLPVIGENIPEICFSIMPEKNGPTFQTEHINKVLFNKKSISKATIKNQDIIHIDNIQIQIHLL